MDQADKDVCTPNDHGHLWNLLEVATVVFAIALAAKHDPLWLVFCVAGGAFLAYRETVTALLSGMVAAGVCSLLSWQTGLSVEYNYTISTLIVSMFGALAAAFLLTIKDFGVLVWETIRDRVLPWPQRIVWSWFAVSLGYLSVSLSILYNLVYFGSQFDDAVATLLACLGVFSIGAFYGVVQGFRSRIYLLGSGDGDESGEANKA